MNRPVVLHWHLCLSYLSFCASGNLHPIVCQICNGDEKSCPLALRQPRGVNKHQRNTKGKKHSCSIWVKDGLAWVGLQTEPPSLLLKGSVTGREGQLQDSPQSNTSLFMLWCLFPLCSLPCFVCPAKGVFPSSPASPVLTIKQSLDDGWALCISSLSEPMATQPKIDRTAGCKDTHARTQTQYLLHTSF